MADPWAFHMVGDRYGHQFGPIDPFNIEDELDILAHVGLAKYVFQYWLLETSFIVNFFSVINVTLEGRPVTGVIIPPGPLAAELGAPVGEGIWAVEGAVEALVLLVRRMRIVLWAP